jgi:hypothetical protein
MPPRFYRRVRLLPGLRMNLGKRGVILSIGGRGAWYPVGAARPSSDPRHPRNRALLDRACSAGRGAAMRASIRLQPHRGPLRDRRAVAAWETCGRLRLTAAGARPSRWVPAGEDSAVPTLDTRAQTHSSKYPPAKPGALGFEPLKAACRPLTRPRFLILKLTLRINTWHVKVPVKRNALSPTPTERRGQSCRVSFFLPSKSSRVHTATVGNVKLLLPPRQSRGNSQDIRRPDST